jgi:hypothetical protein
MRRWLCGTAMVLMVAPFACVVRPRLCASMTECGATQACIAGRCQPSKGTPAIAAPQVRRLVISPLDVAYITSRERAGSPSEVPPILVLGRHGDGAALLLRFSAPIAQDEEVVEAYVLLDRAASVEADPQPISLHAARIIDPWDGRSISWERQPRWEETGAPGAIVSGGGRPLVRIDVKDLVTHWKTRDPRDQGIIILADDTSATGMAFAALSDVTDQGATSMLGASTAGDAPWVASPPRLELYLRPVQRQSLDLGGPQDAGVEASVNAGPDASSNRPAATFLFPAASAFRPHK